MGTEFKKTSYLEALKESGVTYDPAYLQKQDLKFTYGKLSREQFNVKYSPKGWVGRKFSALPKALWSGTIKVIYHLAKGIFIGIPYSCCDKRGYLKAQFFHIGRDFQESYGRLTTLFNDRYGEFYVQKSQFHKTCYDCATKKMNFVKEALGSPLYKEVDKQFVKDIWKSNDYSDDEKNRLIDAANQTYKPEGKFRRSNEFVLQTISSDCLEWFAVNNPKFSQLPIMEYYQFRDDNLQENMKLVLPALPKSIEKGPRIYAQLVQEVHMLGDHRTAFIIDMDNKTVEYLNSFDSDNSVKEALTELANKLSKQYGVTFNYVHRTQGVHLQKGGFECGIWICKLIKERLKHGINFNPDNLKNFDIMPYFKKVFANAHKYNFFNDVGDMRYMNYLRQNTNSLPQIHNTIYSLLKNKLESEGDERDPTRFLKFLKIEWGRNPKQIPLVLDELLQKAFKAS